MSKWEFDVVDKDTPTNEAILQVLLDIRMVLADMSSSIDGIYGATENLNGREIG